MTEIINIFNRFENLLNLTRTSFKDLSKTGKWEFIKMFESVDYGVLDELERSELENVKKTILRGYKALFAQLSTLNGIYQNMKKKGDLTKAKQFDSSLLAVLNQLHRKFLELNEAYYIALNLDLERISMLSAVKESKASKEIIKEFEIIKHKINEDKKRAA